MDTYPEYAYCNIILVCMDAAMFTLEIIFVTYWHIHISKKAAILTPQNVIIILTYVLAHSELLTLA